jgi:hypothetical protein
MDGRQYVVVQVQHAQLSQQAEEIFVQSKETVAIQIELGRVSNANSAEEAGIKIP